MRVGIIGAGGIAWKHAQAYKNIGYPIAAVTDRTAERGHKFADAWGAELRPRRSSFASARTRIASMFAPFPVTGWRRWNWREARKHVLVEKPMAVDLQTAARMVEVARAGGIQLGVVSQHRFDDSTLFLKRAIEAGQLGRSSRPMPT